MVFKKSEKATEKTQEPVIVPPVVKEPEIVATKAKSPTICRVRFSQPVECRESKTSFTVPDDGKAEYFENGVMLTFSRQLNDKGKPRTIRVYFSNIAYIEEKND